MIRNPSDATVRRIMKENDVVQSAIQLANSGYSTTGRTRTRAARARAAGDVGPYHAPHGRARRPRRAAHTKTPRSRRSAPLPKALAHEERRAVGRDGDGEGSKRGVKPPSREAHHVPGRGMEPHGRRIRAGTRALAAAVERAARGQRREREARPEREAHERRARAHEGAADGRRTHAAIIAQRGGWQSGGPRLSRPLAAGGHGRVVKSPLRGLKRMQARR